MISEHTWIVGGNNYSNLASQTVNNVYINELINYVVDQQENDYEGTVASTYRANVGLIYISDYEYAALPTYWTKTSTSYYSAKDSNWLYNGVDEWTITRSSQSSAGAFAVRPCFYLSSDVLIQSGQDTQSNPYILKT